jgi:protein-L-isoaspartate(D-aspartate) O-methyltransferase
MKKFDSARENMVKCQLNTNGVLAPRVLDAFGTVARENYLPENWRHASYIDNDVVCGDGRFMMAPLVHARMVQALEPAANERALVIGDATGYCAAVLAHLVSGVVALESKPGALETARQQWVQDARCRAIETVKGDAASGCAARGPYNLIFVNGAVADVPAALLEQLAPGGRLVAVVRTKAAGMGSITLTKKLENGTCGKVSLYDAATHYLPGLEPRKGFVF